jgi:hypothetical protein
MSDTEQTQTCFQSEVSVPHRNLAVETLIFQFLSGFKINVRFIIASKQLYIKKHREQKQKYQKQKRQKN